MMQAKSGTTVPTIARSLLAVIFLAVFSTVAVAQGEHGGDDKPADSDWVSQTTQVCASCHGKNGVSQAATFPVLAGQYQNYLLHSLKAYRNGERQNGIMAGQVQNFTDAQLKALANYYSQQSVGPLHTPHVD